MKNRKIKRIINAKQKNLIYVNIKSHTSFIREPEQEKEEASRAEKTGDTGRLSNGNDFTDG